MEIEIKVPALGESESEATLVSWLKHEGEAVDADEVLAEIESDKITLEIPAVEAGVLKTILKPEGATVTPGEVIGVLAAGEVPAGKPAAPAKTTRAAPPATPVERGTKAAAADPAPAPEPAAVPIGKPTSAPAGERLEERRPMSGLRRRIAQRLKQAQNTAAILTTFNEVNMQPVMTLRARYREAFKAKHGVDLGLMSFFVKAVVAALQRHPVVNACIEGDDIVYRGYYDIGIAVATDRGLVVPVLRDAASLSMAAIERGIADLAKRAREGVFLSFFLPSL